MVDFQSRDTHRAAVDEEDEERNRTTNAKRKRR